MKTPCCQSRASVTSGIVVRRRPPKRIAEIGTPRGSSYSGARIGHWVIGVQNRQFGCEDSSSLSGVQSRPFQSVRWAGGSVGHALPPDVAVVGQRDVGEDRVALGDGAHRVGVGVPAGAGRDAEQAVLRVDRVEPAVLAEPHPGDVVAEGLDLPARDRRLEHGQVGLAAGAREGRRDVVDLLLRRGELEDQHVLGQPALVAGHRPRRSAASSTSCPAARCRRSRSRRTRSCAPRGTARCTSCRCTARPRPPAPGSSGAPTECRHGTKSASSSSIRRSTPTPIRAMTRIETTTYGESVISTPNIGLRGVQVAHHERDDVHRPAAHRAPVELGHDRLHLLRGHPVVGGSGVRLVPAADEGAVLDPRDVGRVGGAVEASSASCPGPAG